MKYTIEIASMYNTVSLFQSSHTYALIIPPKLRQNIGESQNAPLTHPPCSFAYLTAISMREAYLGSLTAARIKDGFVVASCGWYCLIASCLNHKPFIWLRWSSQPLLSRALRRAPSTGTYTGSRQSRCKRVWHHTRREREHNVSLCIYSLLIPLLPLPFADPMKSWKPAEQARA